MPIGPLFTFSVHFMCVTMGGTAHILCSLGWEFHCANQWVYAKVDGPLPDPILNPIVDPQYRAYLCAYTIHLTYLLTYPAYLYILGGQCRQSQIQNCSKKSCFVKIRPFILLCYFYEVMLHYNCLLGKQKNHTYTFLIDIRIS